jgi:hypothetical protein
MRVVWLALLVASAVALKVPQAPPADSLVPSESLILTDTPPKVIEDALKSVNMQVSHAQTNDRSELPLSGQCFLVLMCTYVLVRVIMYALDQYKYFKGQGDEADKGIFGSEDSLIGKIFDEKTLANANSALSFTPLVSILMLYLMFRAVAQDYDREGSDYKNLQLGMAITTFGIITQAATAFAVNLHSALFDKVTLAEVLGSVCTYFGLAVMFWGIFAVRIDEIPVSTPSKCVAALVVLFVGTMIVIKIMEVKKRFIDSVSPIGMEAINAMLDENRLEEIRNAASFVPFFLIVLFYVNFRYYQVGTLPDYVEVGIIGCSVGIYLQAIVVLIKPYIEGVARIARFMSVMSMYVFFLIAMVALVEDDWPGASIACTHMILLVFAMGVLKADIVILQEVAQYRIDEAVEEEHMFASTLTVFKSMMATTGFGKMVCILLLFVHFRASLLLNKADVDGWIDSEANLKLFIYVITIPIYLQMLVQLVSALTGPNAVLTGVTAGAIAVLHVGLVGIVYLVVA